MFIIQIGPNVCHAKKAKYIYEYIYQRRIIILVNMEIWTNFIQKEIEYVRQNWSNIYHSKKGLCKKKETYLIQKDLAHLPFKVGYKYMYDK